MNWLNNVIVDVQKKIWNDDPVSIRERSQWGRKDEQESAERLNQFQSRLADLDRRIMDLR